MRKKIVYVFLSIFLVFLVILVVFLGSNWFNSTKDTTLKIGYNIENINHGPIMVAYDAGVFDKYKLKVELIPLKSGKEIQQALALGEIDIGSAGAAYFFVPIFKRAPVKIIAPSTFSSTVIFVRPDSNITTFNDLIGKTIASRIGEKSNIALISALKKENISLDQINFIDIEKNLRLIALMDKKIIDVSLAGIDETKLYLNRGAIPFEEWKTKGYANKPSLGTSIAVNSDFMAKNKKIVELFIDTFIDSQKFIKDNPDQAAIMIAKHIEKGTDGAVKYSMEDVKDSWKDIKYILWCDPYEFVEISKAAEEIGDLESALNLSQIFDLSFEEKLKNAQSEIYPSN